jgi:excisionase family DNA binding protein
MPESPNAEEPWLTKAEAALRLGVSERTIETWISERKLGSKPLPRSGKRPATMVDPADVERVAASSTAVPSTAPHQPAAAAVPLVAQLLAAAFQPQATPQPKPFLTLAAAAEFSGLPAGLLRKLIRQRHLKAARHGDETYIRTADIEQIHFDGADPADREALRKQQRRTSAPRRTIKK